MSTALVKAVVDCSKVGALAPETAAALASGLREAALAAIENDDLERAAALMQDAKDALAAGVATTHELVELDADEAAAHHAGQADAAKAQVARRNAEIVAQCDRYLAQTDWIMAPAAGRPVDMPEQLAKTCDKNAKAWWVWRAKVRTIRDAAAAGTANPDTPGLPDQPAAPAVTLT